MPVGEVVADIIGGAMRVVVQFVLEFVLEMLIKGPGHAIARTFRSSANPDGALSICAGLLFWACIGLLGFGLYWHFLASAA